MSKALTTISRAAGLAWADFKAATKLRFPTWGSFGGAWQGFGRLGSFIGGRYPGSNINYQHALGDISTQSLIMAASNWLGRRLPEAPLQVVETDAKGNDKAIPNHDLVRLLRRPNPYFSGATLWKHFAFSWILDANVYWWLIRNARGQVIQIWPLQHWMVTPYRIREGDYVSYYEYQYGSGIERIAPEDMVHFRDGIDPDNDMRGMSGLRSLFREVFTDNQVANFSAALMLNSGVPSLMVSFKEAPAMRGGGSAGEGGLDNKIRQLQAEIQRRVSGDERGKVFVTSWPLDVQPMSFDPDKLDLKNLRRLPEERVAAVLGIPAVVLGYGSGQDRSIYNNVESAKEDATEGYLVPLWGYIEEEINTHLLTEEQFNATETQSVKHDLSKVKALEEDIDALHDRIRKDVTAGVIKVKDAQAKLNYPVDEQADYYLRPGSMQAVKSDGTPWQPQQAQGSNQPPASGSQQQASDRPEKALPLEYGQKAARKFSIVMADITGPVADDVLAYGRTIPDSDLAPDGRETEPHITIKYGLHTSDPAEIQSLLENHSAFAVVLGQTDYFAGDEFDVVYVKVRSIRLHLLNAELTAFADNTQIQPFYVPHITVAYVKPGKGREYAGADFLAGRIVNITELVFSNQNREQTVIKLADMISVF